VVRGASGTGLAVTPSRNTGPGARAIHVANSDNTRENFYVDMSGQLFARKGMQTEGGVVAYNFAAGHPVYQAIATDQAAFFANAQNPGAIAFLAKPISDAVAAGTALAVETADGRDVASVDMNGAAAFASLAIAGEALRPPLRATSAALGGAPLANGRCAQANVHVQGAAPSMAVVVAPAGGVDPGDGFFVRGFVSAIDAVVVKVCNATGSRAAPAATVYNVRVIL